MFAVKAEKNGLYRADIWDKEGRPYNWEVTIRHYRIVTDKEGLTLYGYLSDSSGDFAVKSADNERWQIGKKHNGLIYLPIEALIRERDDAPVKKAIYNLLNAFYSNAIDGNSFTLSLSISNTVMESLSTREYFHPLSHATIALNDAQLIALAIKSGALKFFSAPGEQSFQESLR